MGASAPREPFKPMGRRADSAARAAVGKTQAARRCRRRSVLLRAAVSGHLRYASVHGYASVRDGCQPSDKLVLQR